MALSNMMIHTKRYSAMYDVDALLKNQALGRAVTLAKNKGHSSAIFQLLVHTSRALALAKSQDASYNLALGSAISSLKCFGLPPKPFMYWSEEVVALGEISLALCSRVCQMQNYFGQSIYNLLDIPNSPKSFTDIVKPKHLDKLSEQHRKIIDLYWTEYGQNSRKIRDHEQHHPVDIGNCWLKFGSLPELEIEYPLTKENLTVNLVASSKLGLWRLVQSIDECLEIAGVEVENWEMPSPQIDQHDPRFEADGVMQIIDLQSFPRRSLAIEKSEEKLVMKLWGSMPLQSDED